MAQTAKVKKEFLATGRRKTAIARIRLMPGSGAIHINKKPIEKYFGNEVVRLHVLLPLKETKTKDQFDVNANVQGGGTIAQADAVKHGISRALIIMNPELRKSLKTLGLLTRDPREKERRKVGCRKARRRPQYSKR